jgi:hypothetical protein
MLTVGSKRGRRWLPAVGVALAIVATGAGLPSTGARAATPDAPPSLSLPDDAQLATDAALVVDDDPGSPAASDLIDLDAVIDRALETADALPAHDWEIEALAATLGGEPEAAFRVLRDRIRFQPYPGALRGAEGTLVARAGNAWDRALLLRSMLDAMGVPSRFAFGELDEDTARSLVAHTLDAPVDPFPEGGAQAATTLDLGALATRARRDHALLRAALDAGGRSLGGGTATPDELIGETRPHAWVQVEVDGAWVDLDPSLPDAQPGQRLALLTATGDVLPDAAWQAATIEVHVEMLDGGVLGRDVVLQRRLRAAEAAASEVFLFFQPSDTGGGLLGDVGQGPEYRPVLMVDREAQEGAAFRVPDEDGIAFGFGRGDGPWLAGIWLRFIREAPDRPASVTEVPLLDRVPGHARGTSGIELDDLQPLAATDAGPVAMGSLHHVVLSTGGASPRGSAIGRAAAAWFAGTELDDPATASEYGFGDLLWPLSVADSMLALASERLIVPALDVPGEVAAVIDRPRIQVLAVGSDPADPARLSTSIDLAADEIRLVAADGSDPTGLAHRRLWYGVLESALETQSLLRSAAWADPVGRVLAAASLAMDQPLTVLADATSLPTTAAPALHRALQADLTVLVPGDPASARVWWTVDEADGSTRAILAPGLGGARDAGPRRLPVYQGGMDFDPWERGMSRSARSNITWEVDPNTMRTTGYSRGDSSYRHTKQAPRKRDDCRRGTEYVGIIGCVSAPAVWVAGTVAVVIVGLAVVRLVTWVL